jgi:GDSL-like Lipase/Acylhydrolase family
VTVGWLTGDSPTDTVYAPTATGQIRACGTTLDVITPDLEWYNHNDYDGAAGGGYLLPVTVEFWSNATDLRVYTFNYQQADVWVLVDDCLISEAVLFSPDVNAQTLQLTQSSAIWHKYRISVAQVIGNISVNSGAVVVPTTPVFQTAVIGDSYAEGVYTNDAISPGVAGSMLANSAWGWFEQYAGIDVWRQAISGTGYCNPGTLDVDAVYGSAARMAKLAAKPTLDAIFMVGTDNDLSYPIATVITAAQAAWAAAKTAQPNAKLIVVGVEPRSTGATDATALNSALIGAAAENPNVDVAVDVLSGSFITGSGSAGSPTGDGNADAFVSSDGLHPTPVGARYYGENYARILGSIHF